MKAIHSTAKKTDKTQTDKTCIPDLDATFQPAAVVFRNIFVYSVFAPMNSLRRQRREKPAKVAAAVAM